ncbi:hypothetical protein B0H13DRAFT_1865823 [Mycena leptocephala]|nr:hypothetical protein B0H13DRAFT_1865823 [Mycena leptocephala]
MPPHTYFGSREKIYSAVLVFVTQTLSFRCNLSKNQTLTATHDCVAAWEGIGSAALHIWHQKTAPASIIGVLSAFGYLVSISILHISTPALFSLEAFNVSRSVAVSTQGLPAFNFSADSVLSQQNWLNASGKPCRASVANYALGSLSYLPFMNQNPTPGLDAGSLYDVVDPDNEGQGNVIVSATGFNITCGYFTDFTKDTNSLNLTGTLYFWPALVQCQFSIRTIMQALGSI